MRELSLHILDMIENSVCAGASMIIITLAENEKRDMLNITVEDDGPGLSVSPEAALDPFFTTKNGKRMGLGLSLFRSAAEQAGGRLALRESVLGGLAVEAIMQLNHVDRAPLGNIAATVSSVACTNPEVDLWCKLHVGEQECIIRVSDIAKELPIGKRSGLAVARRVSERINAGLEAVRVKL